MLNDWESTRHGQIKFITESKEKQLSTITFNYKEDSTRELRLKHEIESKLMLGTVFFINFANAMFFFQHFWRIKQPIMKI